MRLSKIWCDIIRRFQNCSNTLFCKHKVNTIKYIIKNWGHLFHHRLCLPFKSWIHFSLPFVKWGSNNLTTQDWDIFNKVFWASWLGLLLTFFESKDTKNQPYHYRQLVKQCYFHLYPKYGWTKVFTKLSSIAIQFIVTMLPLLMLPTHSCEICNNLLLNFFWPDQKVLLQSCYLD